MCCQCNTLSNLGQYLASCAKPWNIRLMFGGQGCSTMYNQSNGTLVKERSIGKMYSAAWRAETDAGRLGDEVCPLQLTR